MPPLKRAFYERPTVTVARDLLGQVIILGGATARIVETEAYLGAGDAAAHSYSGITRRTQVIFGEPGHAYVYLIYGMHYCLNVVAEAKDIAGCVLIRAVEPVGSVLGATNGPGKLTRALGITLAHNGCDLTKGPLKIHAGLQIPEDEIVTSCRIGITKSADLPLRFFVKGNRFVSRGRLNP